MQLNQWQNAHRLDLDNKLRDAAFEAPFHQGCSKGVGDRTGESPAGPVTWRDAMARNFPDVRSYWALDLAKLGRNLGQHMRTRRRQQPLITKNFLAFDIQHIYSMF